MLGFGTEHRKLGNMRIALISSPRSGNTWLRYLLASIYGLQQHAVHDPSVFDWDQAADDCILQLHWRRSNEMLDLLSRHNFKVVTIGRHPLDVLVSILHFCGNEPATRQWLLGHGGDESEMCGRSPLSPEFLRYATSARAKALLAITPAWWAQQNVTPVRYEDLVKDTAGTLKMACRLIGPIKSSIDEAVAALSLQELKATSSNDHFWQGRPGLWQQVLPASVSIPLMQTHADVLAALGYSREVPVAPEPEVAAALWDRLG